MLTCGCVKVRRVTEVDQVDQECQVRRELPVVLDVQEARAILVVQALRVSPGNLAAQVSLSMLLLFFNNFVNT